MNIEKKSSSLSGLSKLIKPALNFAGIVGTVGGFVADVLSPIGPIITYLIYISIGVLIISTAILLLLPANKRDSLKSVSVTSLFFAIIFVLFGQVNEDTENGFLGDNIEFIAEFQSTLNIIDEKLDKISDQVAVVDEKIDIIDNKLDEGFNDLAQLIKTSNPIQNPSTPKDYLLNAYLYKNGGDLKKSESSFLKFFELTESYKIDVLADYLDVIGSLNGRLYVKTFFETSNSDDEVFKLFKTIYTSENDEIIDNIKKLDINTNLIDFGMVQASNNANFWNSLAFKGIETMNQTAINLNEYQTRLFDKGLADLGYLIINPLNVNRLLYTPYNAYTTTFISFYYDDAKRRMELDRKAKISAKENAQKELANQKIGYENVCGKYWIKTDNSSFNLNDYNDKHNFSLGIFYSIKKWGTGTKMQKRSSSIYRYLYVRVAGCSNNELKYIYLADIKNYLSNPEKFNGPIFTLSDIQNDPGNDSHWENHPNRYTFEIDNKGKVTYRNSSDGNFEQELKQLIK